jgi:hypothetical protein
MPKMAVERHMIRLRNHKILIRTLRGSGINDDSRVAGGTGVELLAIALSWRDIWASSWAVAAELSAWSHLYESIMKAVIVAENKPA